MINASEQDLEEDLERCLQIYTERNETFSDMDRKLFKFVLNNIERDRDGRIVSPVLWRPDIEARLATNEHLARCILRSTLSKLKRNPTALQAYDDVIKQQLRDNIIEPIDLSEMKNSGRNFSFLAHSAVVRAEAQTTKVRVVFMGNLADKRFGGLSHNDVSYSGANLNYALLDNLTLLRFDNYLITFDLVKAFLQIRLKRDDSDKLLFMWVRNATEANSDVVVYRFLRLAFGMRWSPCILLTVLYYILMHDTDNDSVEEIALKRLLYMCSYMDNIAYSCNNIKDVWFGYEKSKEIFEKCQFPLQKFVTNASFLQYKIDSDGKVETPDESPLFGIIWNRKTDEFRCKRINFDPDACTRRQVLRTVNGQFDINGCQLPLMIRAKYFLQALQSDKSLDWDTNIGPERHAEWSLICTQANRHETVAIPRNVGPRNGRFRLCVCTDASHVALGLVIYIWDISSNQRSFLLAKSRLLGKDLRNKSIPVLELIALTWGTEVVQRQYRLLTQALVPVSVDEVLAFTDSSIALSWVRSRVVDFGKIERKAVIVNNKVNKIISECEDSPVTFNHISGCMNPADFCTRTCSSAILSKSNFHSGPPLTVLEDRINSFVVGEHVGSPQSHTIAGAANLGPLPSFDLPIEKFTSSFQKNARIVSFLRNGALNIKQKLANKYPQKYSNFQRKTISLSDSKTVLLLASQKKSFPEIFQFFENKSSNCPNLVTRLNIVQDSKGLLRVKSKMDNIESERFISLPILLPTKCCVTRSIILDIHKYLKHGQVFKVLSILREEFYVPSAYSVVKGLIRQCFICRKLHAHSLKSNTNAYRDFRINPGKRPYTTVMIDFIPDFLVKVDGNGTTHKHHILVFTCMHTRHVNLVVCPTMDTESFLFALQMHIYEYGLMSRIISDNQVSFIKAINHVRSMLQSPEIETFLTDKNITLLMHTPYPANASFLGSCVESLVKEIKHILYASIGKRLLSSREFELCVAETKHLVNKRPIVLKEILSSNQVNDEIPFAITPELLIKGYVVPSLNILPHNSSDELEDQDWSPNNSSKLFDSYKHLSAVRNNIANLYDDFFLKDLEMKATNAPNRYKKYSQADLKLNDVVSIKTKLLKPFHYPVGTVESIEKNSLGEINAISVRKSNGEIIRRHPCDIVPLLSFPNSDTLDSPESNFAHGSDPPPTRSNPERGAKAKGKLKTAELISKNLV